MCPKYVEIIIFTPGFNAVFRIFCNFRRYVIKKITTRSILNTKNANFFANFCENIFKIITLTPGCESIFSADGGAPGPGHVPHLLDVPDLLLHRQGLLARAKHSGLTTKHNVTDVCGNDVVPFWHTRIIEIGVD
jgi:hypothetical protein